MAQDLQGLSYKAGFTSIIKNSSTKIIYSSCGDFAIIQQQLVAMLQGLKVQMKCFFLFPNLKEQQKSGRLPFTVS